MADSPPKRPERTASGRVQRLDGRVKTPLGDVPRRLPLYVSRRYLLLALVPFVLMGVGTLGYVVLEGWSAFDALYMTVITLTTVGYGEIPEALSPPGRWFTIFLLLGGVFTLF